MRKGDELVMKKCLEDLRQEIDRLDDQILPLLNRRAGLAIEIGRIKKSNGMALHNPAREREVIERLAARSEGPMTAEAIRQIYHEIMSVALALEETDSAS